MLAEPSAQVRLLDLAAVDTEIAQLLHKRKTLPEHAEIATLAEARKALTETLVAANTALSDAQYALEKAERDIDPVRDRIERDQQRIDSGSVTDPKVVSGLVDEVTNLKRRLSDLEDGQLEAMQVVEDAAAAQATAQAQRERGDVTLRQLMADRDAKAAEIDAEVADKRVERAALVSQLPADLVAAYDKTHERTGLGAAKLSRGRCTGCGLELNPAELRRIEATARNEVVRCEECGRILVRLPGEGH